MERSRWNGFGRTFSFGHVRKILDLSPEKGKTKTRDPHVVNTPFRLVFNHSHHNQEEAREKPAKFLTCAKYNEAALMNIKYKSEENDGDALDR